MKTCVVITGIRDPDEGARAIIQKAMEEIVGRDDVSTIICGGARGVDTLALFEASIARKRRANTTGFYFDKPTLRVIVPGMVNEQPRSTRRTTQMCADTIRELRLPLSSAKSFQTRNEVMLSEGQEQGQCTVVAFSDGRTTGGTANMIREAERRGVPVTRIQIPAELRRAQ